MSGTKVPRDPNLSPELRRFLDDLSRLADTLNTSGFATIASPTFTGDPKAPTPSPGDNDTSIATSAFVTAAIAAAVALLPLGLRYVASGSFSGASTSITSIPTHKLLVFQYVGASHNDGSNRFLRVALSSNNGSSYGTANQISGLTSAATAIHGTIFIGTVDGGASHFVTTGASFGAQETVVTGAIDAIQFSFDAGSFDAGTYILFAI